MSLNAKPKLKRIALELAREMRKHPTKAEKIFWEMVRNRRFYNIKFYRQYPLFYDFGGKESFFITDFYIYEKKLAVEIDGKRHEKTKEEDAMRTEMINHLGISVARFKNEEILYRIEEVKERLKEYLFNQNF